MRNLVLINQFFQTLGNNVGEIVGITEVDENNYYIVTRDAILYGMDIRAGKIFVNVNLKEPQKTETGDEPPIMPEEAKITGIQYVAELEGLCIVTDMGDIIIYNVQNHQMESVGIIEEGILRMAWSPDQELVVFATGGRTLTTMTKDWEMVSDNPITKEEEEKLVEDVPQICWRGDGKYYAVNTIDKEGKRHVYVWERTGTLFSKSQVVDGIGENISWRPDGSIIASHQYLSNQNVTNIFFLEKNGLQHYDFLLEKGQSKVKSIEWNSQSDVLCVFFVPHNEEKPIIQLWFRNNYHWYLKQEIRTLGDASPVFVSWDADIPHRLHVVCEDGKYWCNDFCWDHHYNTETTKDNPMNVMVIDGNKVLMTPFRYAVVPPPMSSVTLELEGPINQISCGAKGRTIIGLSNGVIKVYDVPCNNKPPKFGIEPELKCVLKEKELLPLRLITNISDDTIYGVEPTKAGSGDSIVSIKFNAKENKIESLQKFTYDEKIVRITKHHLTGNVFVETESGAIFKQLSDKFEKTEHSFGGLCQWIQPCMMRDEEVLIGLNDRGVLYIQSQVAASNCSSFVLNDQFLLFTTYAHQLRIVPLDEDVNEAIDIAINQKQSQYDTSFRAIERGGKIVVAVPHDIRVVLQMPRGNLEGINPRALILAHMRELLNEHDYKNAVIMARKHKTDLNIIYDHNPKDFLERVEEFVRQVDEPSYIDLFLSQLQNEDVTEKKYPSYHYGMKPTPEELKVKVNSVCKALRSALEKVNEKKFISSILTTYVKHEPQELHEALIRIRQYRLDEIEGKQDQNKPSADKALDHLIFIANVDKLYDFALGMYDFDLVLMIAQKSQKDPKEYIPFLTKLQQMEKYYQRYSIDMHLKRYESALRNITQADDKHFDECLQLIKDQKLYTLALKLFEDKPEKRAIILEAFGEYNISQKQYRQAAFAFLESRNLEKAQEAFILDGDYKYTFTLAKQMKQIPQEISKIGTRIVNVLQSSNRVKEAAIVLKDYLDNVEEAVVILVQREFWSDALHFASLSNRLDLIQTNIEPEIESAYEQRLEDIEENYEKLVKYIKRLKELRKEKRQQEIVEAMQDTTQDDAFSDTGSLQSGMSEYSGVSIYSATSTMSRRSISKKKRQKMRKGSPFEEDQLVIRIGTLIPTQSHQEDISQLLQVLIYFNRFKEAKNIQQKFEQIIKYCLENKEEIEKPYTPPIVEGEPIPETKYPKKVQDILGNVNWKLDILSE